jgi:tyrosyl-tRNA synthetase
MGGRSCFALTAPLITTSSGAKMGKTAAGAVWLNADLVSPYEYWQFWRNTEDADVGRFLKLFTVLPLDEIERLTALKGARSTRPRRSLPLRRRAWCTAAPRPSKRRPRRAPLSRKAEGRRIRSIQG